MKINFPRALFTTSWQTDTIDTVDSDVCSDFVERDVKIKTTMSVDVGRTQRVTFAKSQGNSAEFASHEKTKMIFLIFRLFPRSLQKTPIVSSNTKIGLVTQIHKRFVDKRLFSAS